MARILVVDDNETIRRSLKSIIAENREWTVCGEAVNGHEAVIAANRLKPELIILDIAMPIMDGLHAAAEISKTMPDIPIVLYTMHKSEQIELEGKKAGARRVLSKTDSQDALLQCVQQLLSES